MEDSEQFRIQSATHLFLHQPDVRPTPSCHELLGEWAWQRPTFLSFSFVTGRLVLLEVNKGEHLQPIALIF